MKKFWWYLVLGFFILVIFMFGAGCVPNPWVDYTIVLKESQVAARFEDIGGPDQYVVVKHNKETILWTETKEDTYHAVWWNESADFKFMVGDVLKVWLMDKDIVEDDVIAYWVVYDPYKLEKLSSKGTWVKFKVERLK